MTVNLEHESLTIGVTNVVTSYDQSIANVSMHRSSFVVVPPPGLDPPYVRGYEARPAVPRGLGPSLHRPDEAVPER